MHSRNSELSRAQFYRGLFSSSRPIYLPSHARGYKILVQLVRCLFFAPRIQLMGSIVETRTPKQTSISTVSFLPLETLLETHPILYAVHALHRKRALKLDIGLHCRRWCELG